MDNVTTVEKLYADFASGDMAAVLAAFDDHIEWRNAEGHPYLDAAPTTVGPQEVVDHVFARIPQDFDGFTVQLHRIVGLGDTVLAEGRYAGTGKATGLPLDAQVANVWDFVDGKVVRWQEYVDPTRFRAVLGL
jgi:ketosteroid isomerase-like protein